MRSKVFQKVLDNIENKSFWYRFKLKLKVELHCIKVLGIKKYIVGIKKTHTKIVKQ
jgi:hypothetical protein